MKKQSTLLVLFFVFCFATSAVFADDDDNEPEEIVSDADVIILTSANHTSTQSGIWLVEYYSPGCGFCTLLTPTWSKLATKVKAENLGFKVAKIDCTAGDNGATCGDVSAWGYPTIYSWINGKKATFRKSRKIEDFILFIEEEKAKLTPEQLKKATDAVSAPPAPAAAPAAAAPAAAATDAQASDESNVANLSADTFDSTIAKGIWLVKFYAPWCGHCKRMAPTWDELATIQKAAGGYGVAKVDCTVERDLGSKYGVRGFPTIKLFKDGQFVTDHKGPRTIEGFNDFVKEHRD